MSELGVDPIAIGSDWAFPVGRAFYFGLMLHNSLQHQ